MESDMRDKELVFYTGHGERKGGFFVAEVDGKPVGTVAYQEKVRLIHSPKKGYRSKIPEEKEIESCRITLRLVEIRTSMEIDTVQHFGCQDSEFYYNGSVCMTP